MKENKNSKVIGVMVRLAPVGRLAMRRRRHDVIHLTKSNWITFILVATFLLLTLVFTGWAEAGTAEKDNMAKATEVPSHWFSSSLRKLAEPLVSRVLLDATSQHSAGSFFRPSSSGDTPSPFAGNSRSQVSAPLSGDWLISTAQFYQSMKDKWRAAFLQRPTQPNLAKGIFPEEMKTLDQDRKDAPFLHAMLSIAQWVKRQGSPDSTLDEWISTLPAVTQKNLHRLLDRYESDKSNLLAQASTMPSTAGVQEKLNNLESQLYSKIRKLGLFSQMNGQTSSGSGPNQRGNILSEATAGSLRLLRRGIQHVFQPGATHATRSLPWILHGRHADALAEDRFLKMKRMLDPSLRSSPMRARGNVLPSVEREVVPEHKLKRRDYCNGLGKVVPYLQPLFLCNGTQTSLATMKANNTPVCSQCNLTQYITTFNISNIAVSQNRTVVSNTTTLLSSRTQLVTQIGTFYPNGTVVTAVSTSNLTCVSSCCTNISTTAYRCACPSDRYGTFCENPRPFSCPVRLLSPALSSCLATTGTVGQKLADLKSRCFMANMSQLVMATYLVNCSFDPTTFPPYTVGTNFSNINDSQFTMNISGSQFWQSTPSAMALKIKIFNFYRLSDSTLTSFVPLTSGQLNGLQNVTFTFNISSIVYQAGSKGLLRRDFAVGNRIYAETSLVNVTGLDGLTKIPYVKQYIDISDPPPFLPPVPVQQWVSTGVNVATGQPEPIPDVNSFSYKTMIFFTTLPTWAVVLFVLGGIVVVFGLLAAVARCRSLQKRKSM